MRQDHNLVTNATSSLFSDQMKKKKKKNQQRWVKGPDLWILRHSPQLHFISDLLVSVLQPVVFCAILRWDCLEARLGGNLRTDFTRCWQQKKGQTSLLVFTCCTQKQDVYKKMYTNLNGSHIPTANQAAAQTCETRRRQSEADDILSMNWLRAVGGTRDKYMNIPTAIWEFTETGWKVLWSCDDLFTEKMNTHGKIRLFLLVVVL